jgi:hypothetical protein
MPLILPGNVASATASTTYDVDNSCRFNDGDSAYMHKTCSSAFDTDKWTISLWCKRGALGIETRLVSCDNDDGSDDDCLKFQATDQLEFTIYDGGYTGTLKTNAKYRDVSAWYHIVAVWDSGNATAGNRMRLYVNGTEVTSFATDTNPAEDANATFGNTSHPIEIGRRGTNGTQYWDGYLAEVAVCDGQAYAASDFGEFDSDSPTIWKPKDVSGLTFGTSGFYLDFEASDNLGNDANGGTDLTEVNLAAADQCQDSPTNNYNTMNPLVFRTTSGTIYTPTFSEGNTYVFSTQDSTYDITGGTFMVSSGKWYFEWKNAGVGDTSADFSNGVGVKPADGSFDGTSSYLGTNRCYCANGNKADSASVGGSAYGDSWTTDDIIGCYLDLDNSKIYFAKNGTMQNSADVSDGTGFAFDDLNSHDSWIVFNAMADFGVGSQSGNYFNFGNPAFTISSSNSDANGYGSFEYNPTEDGVDFYALCTKNLAEYG